MQILKSRREIEMMRQAGKLAHRILSRMSAAAVAGVTTAELDELARIELEAAGAMSLSRNYPDYKPGKGFPGYTCISINEQVVHGIPGSRVLKDGDVVKIDLALSLNGYCADTATTVGIGKVNPKAAKLLEVTKQTLDMALGLVKPGKKWSEIARLIQWNVEKVGFSIVREFVGHGVGRTMHEDPKVPNFVTPEQLRGDFKLKVGTTIAVEPMVVAGRREVEMLKDGWTIVTKDGQPAAHFEHTIAVTELGADILTDGRDPLPQVAAGATGM